LNQVIRMNDERHQAMALLQQGKLTLPQLYRIVPQDMKCGVVLRCREVQFQSFTDEIRHYGTATAVLWIQVRNVRDRHIIREFDLVVPYLIYVQGCGYISASDVVEYLFILFYDNRARFC